MDRTYQKFLRSGIDLAPIGVERRGIDQDSYRTDHPGSYHPGCILSLRLGTGDTYGDYGGNRQRDQARLSRP